MDSATPFSHELLADALRGMFEMSPLAFCISSATSSSSRYLKVNSAYLTLIGKRWPDICGKDIVSDGAAIDSEARDRRLHLLETAGVFKLEEAEIRHAHGHIIPTLISAQRRVIDGAYADMEIIIDYSERSQARQDFERRLTTVAMTDHLTGLANRLAFDNALTDLSRRVSMDERRLGLAFIDLNGFKEINDRYGHQVGDHVLRVLSDRLQGIVRADDLVARLGGDEFAVLFDLSGANLGNLAHRIRALGREICAPVQVGSTVVRIGAAIGVALAGPGALPQAMLHAADRLMYAAKASGQRVSVRTTPIDEFIRSVGEGSSSS